MGDDAHMRTQAATNILIRHWLPALAEVDHPARAEVAGSSRRITCSS